MGASLSFLKAVKGGNAGPLFAQTLAAAAIAIIQFVAQWLLGKLKGAGGKVGGRLKEIAKKILEGIKKAGKAIVRVAKKVGRAVVKVVKKIAHYAKKGAKFVTTKIKGVVQKIAKSPVVQRVLHSPIVQKAIGLVKKGVAKVKGWVDKGKKKWAEWREKRKKNKLRPEERLERAKAAINPKVEAMLKRGAATIVLRAALLSWRVRYGLKYGLRSLRIEDHGGGDFNVVGRVNPKGVFGHGLRASDRTLLAEIEQKIGKEGPNLLRMLRGIAHEMTTERAAEAKSIEREPDPNRPGSQKVDFSRSTVPGSVQNMVSREPQVGPGVTVANRTPRPGRAIA